MVDALEQRYAEAADGGPTAQQRGMWVHLFDDSLKTRAGIEQVLDTAISANLNTVVVQGTRRHDAFYDSDVLPHTTDPDLEAGLDVLGTLIPAAHARGLQVHVWWSMMPSTHPSMQDEDLGPDHVNTQHGAGTAEPWVPGRLDARLRVPRPRRPGRPAARRGHGHRGGPALRRRRRPPRLPAVRVPAGRRRRPGRVRLPGRARRPRHAQPEPHHDAALARPRRRAVPRRTSCGPRPRT